MKAKIFFSVMFAAFVFTGCGNENKIEGYTTYTNDEYGFTLQYPVDWTYREGLGKDNESIGGAIVVFQSPKEGKKDLFRENLYIFTEQVPDSVKNVDDYLYYSKSTLPNQMQEFKILHEGKAMIDGQKSNWIIFEYVNRMQKVQSLAYLFYVDDLGFVITSTARPESLISFRRTFENIATSIDFE